MTRLAEALADRYRLERELGSGGMATVYLAHDLKHDRKVAIKVLRPELAAVIGAERFLSEIKTTANLQHPHILPLFDSGTAVPPLREGERGTGGEVFLFYVMPYVAGESLRDRLNREKQLPIIEAVRIAKEVGSALDYAHRHGIIHRDIKPENVMLHDGSALVADFGIALAASKAGGTRMTETGMSLGTPHYMSPEQAMGEREITARSDVYALGAMTYEMLLGEPPFTGPTAQSIVAKVMTEKPAPMIARRERIPPAVEDAVLTALDKLPADRWPTAAAFMAALEGQGDPAGARVSRMTRPKGEESSPPRFLRSVWPWAAAVALAVIAALAGWLRPRPVATTSVIRFQVQPPAETRIAFPVSGIGTQLAISPDGQKVVFAASSGGSRWKLYIRNLDQLGARALPGTEGGYSPEFSPNGRWIAFRSADGQLKKIGVDGSALSTLCAIDNYGTVGGGITWISDQEIVFARGTYLEGRGLWRVSSDGGQAVQFTQWDSVSGERLQLAPRAADHGRLVFYSSTVASNADLRIGVAVAATGKVKVFPELRGARPIGLMEGYLLYVRSDGAVMAAPFDGDDLSVGVPLQVSDSVAIPSSAWNSPIALSASGSLLYQKGGTISQLVTVSHGRTEVLIDSAQMYLHPRLSPDGSRVAVEIQTAAGADIWIHNLRDHASERLTRAGFNNRPEWSPDGTRILFTSTRPPGDALWMQPANGSEDATMVVKDVDPIREGVFTPDGQSVLYRVDTRERNRDIYRIPLSDPEHRVPVLVGENDDKLPRVSPDGRWLAYVSNESGREEVYVRPMAGGGRLVISTGGGGEPLWSHDGKRLFYRVGTGIVAASITTSPSLQVTARAPLFDGPFASDIFHPNFDVSRDGETFVMVRPVEANREVVLVVGWREELRRRTGGAP